MGGASVLRRFVEMSDARDRSFWVIEIAEDTPRVLHRPAAEAEIEASLSSRGDSKDSTLAESVTLYETQVAARRAVAWP